MCHLATLYSMKSAFMMKRREGPPSPPPLPYSFNFIYVSIVYDTGSRGGRMAQSAHKKNK